MIQDLQKLIEQLKKEKNVTILAHSYQNRDVLEVADITGDSFRLSVAAQEVKTSTVLVCGVHFMAETVKILSPEKKVLLAQPQAGCPMAEQFSPEFVTEYKKNHVNTTAALKAVCDVCVTSSSAVNIVKKMEAKRILFLPDCNLGSYVKEQVPEKEVDLVQGGCPIHASVTAYEVKEAKQLHPGAEVLVHPECTQEVLAFADYIGSTAEIMNYAAASKKTEFIIGTEISIAEHLSYRCPDKRFYPMSKKLICPDMKRTTLESLLAAMEGRGGEEIRLEEGLAAAARHSLENMLRYGG